MTLASQDADKGQLELTIVARVDDGVQTAVEVAQPKDHLEEGIRGPQVCIKRPWRQQNRENRKWKFESIGFYLVKLKLTP